MKGFLQETNLKVVFSGQSFTEILSYIKDLKG